MNIAQDILQQRWVHSHEEDTADEMVFRPDSFAFPRSRGRTGFDLKPDHTLVETGIAPADGPQITNGKWELSPDGKLTFYNDSASAPTRVLEISSADKDRLVIRK